MVSVGERVGLLPAANFQLEELDDELVRVTRTSIFTRQRNSMDLPIDEPMFRVWCAGQGLVQDVFPQLNADQREFLMSGATPEEWADVFGSDEED